MNNDFLIEYACQTVVILGWFWLILFTILRIDNFRKRYVSVLILIYFMQGLVRISELLIIDVKPDEFSGFSFLSSVLCIFGFTFFTVRYIKFKKYYDEKTNFRANN